MPERVKPDVSNENAIPDGYGWPGADSLAGAVEPLFWISPEPRRASVPRYLVFTSAEGGPHIITGQCYLKWAIRIVDGLRSTKVTT